MLRATIVLTAGAALLLPGCRLFQSPAHAGRRENFLEVQNDLEEQARCATCDRAGEAAAGDRCPECGELDPTTE